MMEAREHISSVFTTISFLPNKEIPTILKRAKHRFFDQSEVSDELLF